jgi:Iap family predicted aminopeptidase
MPQPRPVLPLLAAVLALTSCGSDDGRATNATTLARPFNAARAFRDLRAEVRLGPRPVGSAANRRDARFIVRRLRRAGVEDVRVQRPWRNVVGRLPGSEPGVVVVGAHRDTKDIRGFVGANDGASGVAVLLELARDLPRPLPGPSVDLAFFDAEEARGASDGARAFERTGDRGSRQYARYAAAGGRQGSPPLRTITAMVLFDMVGDCDLNIPREASSSAPLYSLFHDASGPGGPFEGNAGTILDDHTPFERAGVPAVDLIDFDYGPGPPPGAFWHTRDDDLSHVCPGSLAAVGRPSLIAIPRIP